MTFSCSVVPSCHNLCPIPSFPPFSSHRSYSTPHPTLSIRPNPGFPRSSTWVVPRAKKRYGKHGKDKPWWKRFFLEDDGNWLGLKDDDMELDAGTEAGEEEKEEEEGERDKFEAWRRRAEAIVELREARVDAMNEEGRMWEDWIADDGGDVVSWGDDGGEGSGGGFEFQGLRDERGIVERASDFIVGRGRVEDEDEDDDMLYEDRVFEYASTNSAKFLAVLIIIPWTLDFVVHDYLLMPFLDRYVKTVPLAATMLDVRRPQKLEMIKELKFEKARYRFEREIGKSPPLSDDELWWELRNKALELRDEWRLENRKAFANIWSDMVFGISLFLLLYFNQNRVALLKFTGYQIINNISDSGKAFLIILITDIFLGYHSESGWQTLLEVIVEHYGLQIDQSAITVFICFVPVVMDACVKLWLFKFLPRLSPKVANIFREMKRH
ncbi:hypothetical protein MLD38_014153 [Melastoma candidum]|uniref:Uncharacterized protein n=1 Tax=Melastoma candidum TaxID=119954 RepID=A0ACB9RFJ8_9MYRT|nr:hypothetical protein MLD38_014153 [Melastoma candidum]